MFIDEKLQMIWDDERDMKLSVQKIYDTLVTEVVDEDNFFPSVKKADNIFRIFAKKNGLNQDWFRSQVKSVIKETDRDYDAYIKKLGW